MQSCVWVGFLPDRDNQNGWGAGHRPTKHRKQQRHRHALALPNRPSMTYWLAWTLGIMLTSGTIYKNFNQHLAVPGPMVGEWFVPHFLWFIDWKTSGPTVLPPPPNVHKNRWHSITVDNLGGKNVWWTNRGWRIQPWIVITSSDNSNLFKISRTHGKGLYIEPSNWVMASTFLSTLAHAHFFWLTTLGYLCLMSSTPFLALLLDKKSHAAGNVASLRYFWKKSRDPYEVIAATYGSLSQLLRQKRFKTIKRYWCYLIF